MKRTDELKTVQPQISLLGGGFFIETPMRSLSIWGYARDTWWIEGGIIIKRPLPFLSLTFFVLALMQGCPFSDAGNSAPRPVPGEVPPPPPVAGTTSLPRDYFPLTPGSSWSYQGEGNEYASFTRKVLYVEGDRAQIQESNGGTVIAAVYEVTGNLVRRIYLEGEEYSGKNMLSVGPTENTVFLRSPLEKGASWDSAGSHYTVIKTDASVITPAGTFDDCLAIEISNPESEALLYEYYKAGVGMVMREFISGEERVTSSLEAYDIK